jgi:hypothetical protein
VGGVSSPTTTSSAAKPSALDRALATCAKIKDKRKGAACITEAKRKGNLAKALAKCKPLKGKKKAACVKAANKKYAKKKTVAKKK